MNDRKIVILYNLVIKNLNIETNWQKCSKLLNANCINELFRAIENTVGSSYQQDIFYQQRSSPVVAFFKYIL